MKTFRQFVAEAEVYDHEFRSGAQIVRTGSDGRIGRDRKQHPQQARRFKTVRDPETGERKRVPITYSQRSDIGQKRPTGTRVQAPTQERGSAEVTQAAAAATREERRKAALARIAAKKAGGEQPTQTAGKPTAAELAKQANKLLSVKGTPKPSGPKEEDPTSRKGKRSPLLHPDEPDRPLDRDETVALRNAGERLRKDLQKGKDEPFSSYTDTLHKGGRFGYTQERKDKAEAAEKKKATLQKRKNRIAQSLIRRRNARVRSRGSALLSRIQRGED